MEKRKTCEMRHFQDIYLLRVHPDLLELTVSLLFLVRIPDAHFKPLLTQQTEYLYRLSDNNNYAKRYRRLEILLW